MADLKNVTYGEREFTIPTGGTVDAYTKAETDALLADKATQSSVLALQNTAEDLRVANEATEAELTQFKSDTAIDLGGIVERLDTNETAIADRYTKAETDNIIATINSFDVVPVTTLPTENIRTDCIYIVKDSLVENDLFSEYIYVEDNGVSKWERFGSATMGAESDATVDAMIADIFGDSGGTGGNPGVDPGEP